MKVKNNSLVNSTYLKIIIALTYLSMKKLQIINLAYLRSLNLFVIRADLPEKKQMK